MNSMSFRVGANAVYINEDLWRGIVYCAFHNTYFESGLKEYKILSKRSVADADTVNGRIKCKDYVDLMREYEDVSDRIFEYLRSLRCLNRMVLLMIDITEIPYWGNKNDFGVVGTKHQRGTSYCYQYITANILVGNLNLCLYALPVLPMSDKSLLVDKLLNIAKRYVKIRLVLMDRRFANSRVINVLERHGVKYLMPITKNSRIKDEIEHMYWDRKDFNCSEIIEYEFKSGVRTKVFFTENRGKEDCHKVSERYYAWCTNLDVQSETRESVANIYMLRDGILRPFIAMQKGTS
jgi:hypothetical protein